MDDDTNVASAHCPTCRMEYRSGFDTCADDGTALVAGPVPVPGDHHPEPTVLCRLPAEEAVLLAGALEAAGIEAMAENQGYRFPYVNSPTLSGEQNVLVPAARLEDARQVARELLGDAAG